MTIRRGPLLTAEVYDALRAARARGLEQIECSLDLGRSTASVELRADGFRWRGETFPDPARCRPRTIYHFDGTGFQPVARFTTSHVKLVPTQWGPPTFEIDGIKMLPTARVSPYADAEHKVGLIEPRAKRILDTCGGLGYFAACCLAAGAQHVQSYEKNADVLWLRSLNPWSPEDVSDVDPASALRLTHGDIVEQIERLPDRAFDAALHDPPRFGTAGELYSRVFYEQLARVLRPQGRLFHYTGTPNRLTSGRDVAREVATRLQVAGFDAELRGDGVLATRRGRH